MPDITVASDVLTSAYSSQSKIPGPVMVTRLIGYLFYVTNGGAPFNFVYIKTEDGGATWSATTQVNVGALENGQAHGVWWDRVTPGDIGTRIHLAYTSSASVRYRNLNTVGDVLSTERIVISSGSAQAQEVRVGKARNGDLWVSWISNDANIGNDWRRSTNGGDSWVDPGPNAMETQGDSALLLPASNTGDDADMWILFFKGPGSTGPNRLKEWDASASNLTTTSFGGTYISAQWVASLRHSDGHLFLATMLVTPRTLEFWEINGGASIVQRTSITPVSSPNNCGMTIDQATGRIYVAYNTGNPGTNSYRFTDDGGVSWSGITQFSTDSDNFRAVYASLSVRAGDSGLWLPIWFNDTPDDFETNVGSSIALGSAGVPAAVTGHQQKLLLL